jgi:hypothetical protein
MKAVIGILTVLACVAVLLVIAGAMISDHPQRKQTTITRNIYKTPSGHRCTEKDWDRQFLKGVKPGEEPCKIAGLEEDGTVTIQDPDPPDHSSIEELKMNCVRLSRTPMSAMTPKDLDDWDFCKTIIKH